MAPRRPALAGLAGLALGPGAAAFLAMGALIHYNLCNSFKFFKLGHPLRPTAHPVISIDIPICNSLMFLL